MSPRKNHTLTIVGWSDPQIDFERIESLSSAEVNTSLEESGDKAVRRQYKPKETKGMITVTTHEGPGN